MTSLSPVAPVPAHVPPGAIYDFDMFLYPALLADPHEPIRAVLREAPSMFWTPRNGGHWMVTGHKENYAASRDTETFSSEIMPKAMMARKEEVRALANELIDAVIAQGHCDFMPAIAESLPVQVFLKLMGLPIGRMAEFRELVHEFLAPIETPLDPLLRIRKVAEAMRPELEARRVAPQDDPISLLWRTEIGGQPMTYETMEDFGVLLFIAGLDTVINGMGYGIRYLAMDPDFQNELRADPKRIAEAAEELLRRYTFSVPTRRIARDAELGGWQMKEEDRPMLFLPGTDLDPREFPEPERLDLDRENNVHIAFGVGPHRCLGSHLARIELQVIYEQMLARLPTFRIDDTRPTTYPRGQHHRDRFAAAPVGPSR